MLIFLHFEDYSNFRYALFISLQILKYYDQKRCVLPS